MIIPTQLTIKTSGDDKGLVKHEKWSFGKELAPAEVTVVLATDSQPQQQV